MTFIDLNNFPFQLFQIILNLCLLLAILHRNGHNLFLVFSFEFLFNMFQYFLMPGMHQLALVSVRGVTFFEHGYPVFIPLFNGGEAFGGLVVLVEEVLLVLLTLVELLLFLELD